MSFEDALAELEQIVRRLEAGQVKLDEAIHAYERGAQLKRHCETEAERGAAAGRPHRDRTRWRGAGRAGQARLKRGRASVDRKPVAGSAHRSPRRRRSTAELTDALIERLLEAAARPRSARLRGDALFGAGARQAAAAVLGAGRARGCSAWRGAARCRSPRRSRWCTPIRLSMTTCRRWTTAICAAAGRPATRHSTRRPRSWPATGC